MGLMMILTCLVAALGVSLCDAAPVSDSLVVVVTSPVSVHRGHTTVLPCWLSPPQSAEALEVRWYHPEHFDTPVILYREKRFEHASQDASYAGRVSFGSKGPASGGLKAGDVSLKLVNTTLQDSGDYTCYVSSDQGYDSARVSVVVTEKGAPPLLSVVWTEDNLVNVSCESEGWYPEPSLLWSDQKRALSPGGLKHSTDSKGLVSVHSWLLLPSSTQVSCSVGLSGEEAKEARMRLENSSQPESGSSKAGWMAFGILLIVAALAGLALVLYLKNRGEDIRSEGYHAAENQKLLLEDLSAVNKHYVNVALDRGENKYLRVKDGKMRDAPNVFPERQKVTCLTAIKGTPGFSSGQHYWEVSLGNPNIAEGIKHSWWLGVTSANDIPQDSDFSPTASKGYWFLSSSHDKANRLQFSTEPNVLLPVHTRPQKVGVYLNYDSGELSFYDVENKSVIGSLTTTFQREVYPFFNPGNGDISPMEILPLPE